MRKKQIAFEVQIVGELPDEEYDSTNQNSIENGKGDEDVVLRVQQFHKIVTIEPGESEIEH